MAIVRRPHGLWKGVRAGWDKFYTFLSFSAGNGKECGDHSLKEVCVTKIL